MTTVLNIADLIAGDNSPKYRRLPVTIGGNQGSGFVVQFQPRISQWIGDAVLCELRANGTNDHSLWSCALNNETSNHHVVACLDKGASGNVGYVGRRWCHYYLAYITNMLSAIVRKR